MRIGILGTGTLATALGTGWAEAGHEIVIAGRSREKADAVARQIGPSATAATPRKVACGSDAVLLAVLWPGVPDMLELAGAPETLRGIPLIDPTNAVEHGVGELLTPAGISAAEHIARLAPGAHVVKAFHLFAADQWLGGREPVTVALCGDDETALHIVSELVADVGGKPAVLGPLSRTRQLEEVAGFVIGLAFAGVDPKTAIPQVNA